MPINQSNIDLLQVKIICIAKSSTIVHKLFKRNDQLPYQEYSVAPRSLDCIRRGTLRLMGSQRCQPFVHSGLLRLIALAQRLGTYLHGLFLSPLLPKRSLPLPWLCVKATLLYLLNWRKPTIEVVIFSYYKSMEELYVKAIFFIKG